MSALQLLGREKIERRSMFAMQFLDPVSGTTVRDGLRVSARVGTADLGTPIRTLSGRFAWDDPDPAGQRQVRVVAASLDGRFADFEETFDVDTSGPQSVEQRIIRRQLKATGLYQPPAGTTAFAGALYDDAGAVPDARVALAFRHAQAVAPGFLYDAVTDAKGRFLAISRLFETPASPRQDGSIDCWLEVRRGNAVRYFVVPNLRPGQVTEAPALLIWQQLPTVAP